MSLYAAVEVRAEEVDSCTGLQAFSSIEQPYLSRLENGLTRLSLESASGVEDMVRLLGEADDILRSLRVEDLAKALTFAREVERILWVGGGTASVDSTLVAARARFRLTFVSSLLTGDCLKEAETLLAETHTWPISDSSLVSGVIATYGGVLTQLGRLNEATEMLRPFLEADTHSSPRSFTELQARSGALNNLAVALRQSGERVRAKSVYQQVLILLLDPTSVALVRSGADRLTYEGDLARIYLNLAALALFNQDTVEARSYLNQARDAFERAGQTGSYDMVLWFRTDADYWTEVGNEEAALHSLAQGLTLAEQVGQGPGSVVLQSELQWRLCEVGGGDPTTCLQQLLENDQALERRAGVNWKTKVESAEALSRAYGRLHDWDRAVEWARVAHHRMQSVAGPTVELAVIQQALSNALAQAALAKAQQDPMLTIFEDDRMMEAYRMSQIAVRTLREVAEREALGCRLGQERNPKLVEAIREWHVGLSGLMLNMPGVEDSELYYEITDEVLGLVQAQETDRFGAAALRAAARTHLADRPKVRAYESALKEKCSLEQKLGYLSAASQVDQDSLASTSRLLTEVDKEVDAALMELNPVLASALSGGRSVLTREDLIDILRPGEAMLAFRVGDLFSVASLNIRHVRGSTTVTVPLPDAKTNAVEASVSVILNAIDAREPWNSAGESLSALLRTAELQPWIDDVKHVFVVLDGHLRRLPSHLLPVGAERLGDLADSSTVASIWGFVALRQMGSATPSRAVYAIGDPELSHVSCDLIPAPETTVHREVMCLGKSGALEDLLHGAHDLLGGPAPVTGPKATREAMLGSGPKDAGILLFGTHGVIPETKEISYLVEPALVLSPDQADPGEDGLLLASQVAELRLDNSWLAILAACRTGTPSGTDVSDGLSGLSLGFTAAGTDALLVTHWGISPEAAREVVLSMLRRMAANPKLTLSAALGGAMRAYAAIHPDTRAWGSFSILGDGTVTMPFDPA